MKLEKSKETNLSEPEKNFLDKDYVKRKLKEFDQMMHKEAIPKPIPFWRIIHRKKKEPEIILSRTRFVNFLQFHGFYKLYLGSNRIFIRVENNILREVSIDQIKDFSKNYIESQPEVLDPDYELTQEDLLEKVYKNANNLLSDSSLAFLNTFIPTIKKDTSNAAYIFYKDCFVKVTNTCISRLDYSKLKGHIWENQIIDRNFLLLENQSAGDFGKLVLNVSNNDQARYEALRSTIGYLLHSFKDPSVSKAVIFVDEKIATEDASNGGTCKSLVAMAVQKIKATWYRGKDYRLDRSFPYQGINLGTQICLLDDMQKSFNFEYIFTNITNSLTVEGKGQPAFTIPYSDSPKWLITTNYVIKGEGSSYDRRRHIVEFSDHYNLNPRPLEEFGRRLFDDWPNEEWLRFDNFMLQCLQLYLQTGLQEVQVNYKERLLLQTTSEEFVSFMSGLELGTEYNVQELMASFCQSNEEYRNDSSFTTRVFCKWIRLYLKHYQIFCQGDKTASSKETGNKNKPFEERNKNKYLKMLSITLS